MHLFQSSGFCTTPRPLDGLAQDPHRYTVFSTRSITEHVKCAAAGMRKTVYLFDPSTSATEPPQFACRMVISSRPDAKHFAAFVKHNHNVHRYKLNPYTLEEAVEFYELLRHPTNESYAPNVQKFLSDDQIRDGYADVRSHSALVCNGRLHTLVLLHYIWC